MIIAFLGIVPLSPDIVEVCDSGIPLIRALVESEETKAFRKAIEPILKIGAN